MLSSVRLAVFDLDGTLVDSRHNITRAVNDAATAVGLAPPSPELIPRVIGLSLDEALSNLFPGADAAALIELDRVYRGCFVRYRAMAVGDVAPVKVLGVLAMIDGGETDWKVLVVREDDPLAAACADVDDLQRELPGAVHALREWFRVYKLPEGKPLNAFAMDERALSAAYAHDVVHQTHKAWAASHGHVAHPRARSSRL